MFVFGIVAAPTPKEPAVIFAVLLLVPLWGAKDALKRLPFWLPFGAWRLGTRCI